MFAPYTAKRNLLCAAASSLIRLQAGGVHSNLLLCISLRMMSPLAVGAHHQTAHAQNMATVGRTALKTVLYVRDEGLHSKQI